MKATISLENEYNHVEPAGPSQGVWLRLPDVSGLDGLPEYGTITFEFCRKKLALESDNKLSAELCLTKITDVTGSESDEADEKTENVVDKLFDEAKDSPESEEKDE